MAVLDSKMSNIFGGMVFEIKVVASYALYVILGQVTEVTQIYVNFCTFLPILAKKKDTFHSKIVILQLRHFDIWNPQP